MLLACRYIEHDVQLYSYGVTARNMNCGILFVNKQFVAICTYMYLSDDGLVKPSF